MHDFFLVLFGAQLLNYSVDPFRCQDTVGYSLSPFFIPLSMAPTLKGLLPSPDLAVISLGGATEASIWSCWYPIEDVRAEWTSIPYGRALGNQKLLAFSYQVPPSVLVAGLSLLVHPVWVRSEQSGASLRRISWTL